MTGASEFLYVPSVTLGITELFLRQVSQSNPDADHAIVWAGAGFHQKKDLGKLQENIHLVLLPPYSPKLNPMEQLWDPVGVVYANRVYEVFAAIERDITDALRPFWEDARKVFRLLTTTCCARQTLPKR